MIDLVVMSLVGGMFRVSPALVWVVIGDCLTQKCGRFNIGIEGMVPCGAVGAAIAADISGSGLMGLLGGAAAGAILGCAIALCCALPRVSELAVGISFLIGGTALARYVGNKYTSLPAPELPVLSLGSGSALEISPLLPIAALLAFFLAWMFKSTKWGMILTAAGEKNGDAVLGSVGASAKLVRLVATTVGGAFAGVGGASLLMFYPRGWSDHLADGIGISALVLVFLARSRPVHALFAALAYAAITSAGLALQIYFGSDAHHVLNVLPYLAIFLVLSLQKNVVLAK